MYSVWPEPSTSICPNFEFCACTADAAAGVLLDIDGVVDALPPELPELLHPAANAAAPSRPAETTMRRFMRNFFRRNSPLRLARFRHATGKAKRLAPQNG
jgi:hypothetical protein